MKKLVILMGIVFILGGIGSIYAEITNYIYVSSAPYKEEATSNVVSLRINKESSSPDSIYTYLVYYTKEEIERKGEIIEYRGRYSKNPGDSVSHTIISYDDITYEVNDATKKTCITGCIASGLIIIAGIGIEIFYFKLVYHKRSK